MTDHLPDAGGPPPRDPIPRSYLAGEGENGVGAEEREAAHGHTDELVDEASDESFPASDPPASTHTHAGPPDARARAG